MENILFKNLQKSEAVRRLQEIKYFEEHLNDFINENIIYRTEFDGVEFFLSDEEKEMVSEFENKTGNLIFHIIKNNTEFGLLYSLLYVSKHQEEWSKDLEINPEDNNEAYAFVYVKNVTCPDYSEYGSITIRNHIGGLIRTS